MPSSDLIYAIDFGTSNSLLAAADRNGVHRPIALDPDSPDPTILRSLLYFPKMNEIYYGLRAIKEFSKRDMEGRLIRSIKKHLPIRSFIGTYIDDRPVNLEDLIGFFLRELRRRANEHFQADVESVVLGRPARFASDDADDAFAQYRLERAARNAGFKNIEFCPEPVAAAYEFRSKMTETKTVLVADFGGGTSDYTVIRIGKGAHKASDILSIGGVAVAGDALDGAVMRHRIAPHFGSGVEYAVPFGSNVLKMPSHLMERICSPADISLLRKRDVMEFFRNVRQWALSEDDRERMDRLFSLIEDQLGFDVFEAIERTKRGLSDQDHSRFNYQYPGIDLNEVVTRGEFAQLASEQLRRILESLDQTVHNAGLKFEDIDLVCATGGTAKAFAIREALIERFGADKITQHNHFHSVVEGLMFRAKELVDS